MAQHLYFNIPCEGLLIFLFSIMRWSKRYKIWFLISENWIELWWKTLLSLVCYGFRHEFTLLYQVYRRCYEFIAIWIYYCFYSSILMYSQPWTVNILTLLCHGILTKITVNVILLKALNFLKTRDCFKGLDQATAASLISKNQYDISTYNKRLLQTEIQKIYQLIFQSSANITKPHPLHQKANKRKFSLKNLKLKLQCTHQ